MEEINCHNCQAACCTGPLPIELSQPEYDQMAAAGTVFITIAEPAAHDRSDVPHPAGVLIDEGDPGKTRTRVIETGGHWPLAAGEGRYILLGKCANLRTFLGWEHCGIYDERPRVCRGLEVGGFACRFIRQQQGIDSPS
jgi:Fe-S-cluster containining protein